MTERYPHHDVEAKWKARWEASGAHHPDLADSARKSYVLVMFSYPSGDKLHTGHWYNYAPTDSFARFQRMLGKRVLEPMGFDAFGLPAENFAIKTGVHPRASTESNIAFIRTQLRSIGAMYDWAREVDTSQPEYYRWTQWVFLKLHEKGLVYRKLAPVNWCPGCRTVLANDQVIDDRCWRSDDLVVKKDLEQWFVRITDYAERLLRGLDSIDWPEATKLTQRNWIGRSEGAEVRFPIDGRDGADPLIVFTTRPDTLFGATFLVLAPEHPAVPALTRPESRAAMDVYLAQARTASETERTFANREKTGVATGAHARHPLTGELLPIYVADYVLPGYGTGAVMAVPAHDERDHEFAVRHGLPVRAVVRPDSGPPSGEARPPFSGTGRLMGSGAFDGMTSAEGGAAIVAALAGHGLGRASITYRMRDWCVSRQRYWGAPIPMLRCAGDCGWVPVAEKDLPVLLPEQVRFEPGGSGESPLASVPGFVAASCPRCGGAARRETDTMDTFVDSAWYFLRYPCTERSDVAFDPDVVNRWLPVDMYVGGPEHSRGHLIFARFVTMVLHDLGYVSFDEPFTALRHQGIITHHGQRMSKGKGNVVVPDAYVQQHGADVFRLYLMFMGSYEQGGDWSDEGIHGIARYVNRVWRTVNGIAGGDEAGGDDEADADADARDREQAAHDLEHRLHATVDAVTRDLGRMSYNTAIARLMELTTEIARHRRRPADGRDDRMLRRAAETLTLLIAPLAPHLGEELWERLGGAASVFDRSWPVADPAKLRSDDVTLVVQVNGKLRGRVQVPRGSAEEAVREAALADAKVREQVEGRPLKRVVVVPDKLVNLVVG